VFWPALTRRCTQITGPVRIFVYRLWRLAPDDVPALKEGQSDINKLFVEMFGLVLPEKVAEEVVKRDVKLTFDPVTKELIQVVMPFASKTEVMTLKVDKGWVTEASVEDLKLLPGVHRPRCSVCKGANGSRAKSFETSRAAAPNSW
jgi:hypothetical protein